MATQRLIMATFAGESAAAVATLFQSWRSAPNPVAVDRFGASLREHGLSLPIVYFCEWRDGWLMGDLVPGPEEVHGRKYQAACFSPEQALAWAEQCGHQFPEQEWLASRLREAAAVWSADRPRVIVLVREVVGGSTTDEEITASLAVVPAWLSSLGK